MDLLSDNIRRLEELRQNSDLVKKMFEIVDGQTTGFELMGTSETSSKKFYEVGNTRLLNEPINLGVLVGMDEIDPDFQFFGEFLMYLADVALLHDVFQTSLSIRTYKCLGLLQDSQTDRYGFVLESFGKVNNANRKHPQVEELFSYTGGIYFANATGGLIAGDFDKAIRKPKYNQKYLDLYRKIENARDKLSIKRAD